ncbi:uncharacterized protein LOC131061720 [Cryptomeria japonica]|uniref:uncharacterized protein LOC131061720 n=1 Tax=Cryptomeria japonica TaxID=3369 RepID=UPI0025AD42B9|nr:uncharacterized protein LOC131061720 [Cryptomeria japonica]
MARKRKVRKDVEELAEQMGISKEVVQRAREQNILKKEDMVKPKKAKLVSTPPKQSKPRQSQSTPTSGVQKPIPSPKPQAKSTSGAKKRKKEKSQREYVAATAEDVENESDEMVKEVKKTTTYARVVKKPQFDGAQPTKKSKSEVEQSGRARASKKQNSKSDEALKSIKVEVVDDSDNANDNNSNEVVQDPPVVEVVLEKAVEESIDGEKGKDDAEKGEDDGKDASAEVAGKEKGEDKDDQAPVTMARDTLENLAQAKASEDLLKSHNADKELITLAVDVLEKILPSFKPDLANNPSGKMIENHKKIRECEGQLASISHSYAPQSITASNFEPQVLSILDKIKSLNQEKGRILDRVGEVRSLITPRIDSLMSSMQDAKDTLNQSVLADK